MIIVDITSSEGALVFSRGCKPPESKNIQVHKAPTGVKAYLENEVFWITSPNLWDDTQDTLIPPDSI